MKRKNTEIPDLDVARLLALKAYEQPDAVRAEKNIQNIMREVRASGRQPVLQLPDRKFGWMFAQPRYGIAALFVLFLGLHLLDRPMPVAHMNRAALEEPSAVLGAINVDTNRLKAPPVPGIRPVYPPLGGEAATFVNYRE